MKNDANESSEEEIETEKDEEKETGVHHYQKMQLRDKEYDSIQSLLFGIRKPLPVTLKDGKKHEMAKLKSNSMQMLV